MNDSKIVEMVQEMIALRTRLRDAALRQARYARVSDLESQIHALQQVIENIKNVFVFDYDFGEQ